MLSGKGIKLGVFTLFTLSVFLFYGFLFPKLSISYTSSINARLMYITGGEFKKTDIVLFDKTSDVLPKGKATLAKRVFCLGGDDLKISSKKEFQLLYSIISCNDETRKLRVTSYKGLKPFLFEGKIPAAQVFLLGDDDASFDSRYYGFIDSVKLTKVRKIF